MENLDEALDGMVNCLIAYDEIQFLDIVQFVWRRGWPLATASKPKDQDTLRLALKACLVERMVEIWNAPPKNSNETVPEWCETIPAIKRRFSVIEPKNMAQWKNEPSSPIFERRNIFTPNEFMFFL